MNIKLLALLTVLAVPSVVCADEAADLIHVMNLDHQAWLMNKILKIKKGSYIRVDFKNGIEQYFKYESYSKYDDSLWVSPVKPVHGIAAIFAQQAFAIQELLDVRVSEPV